MVKWHPTQYGGILCGLSWLTKPMGNAATLLRNILGWSLCQTRSWGRNKKLNLAKYILAIQNVLSYGVINFHHNFSFHMRGSLIYIFICCSCISYSDKLSERWKKLFNVAQHHRDKTRLTRANNFVKRRHQVFITRTTSASNDQEQVYGNEGKIKVYSFVEWQWISLRSGGIVWSISNDN